MIFPTTHTAALVSPDYYLTTPEGEYVWSPGRAKFAWAKAILRAQRLAETGTFRSLVLMIGIPASGKSTWLKQNHRPDGLFFDATFTQAAQRKPIIDLAKSFGLEVIGVVMLTPINVCLDRNSCRTPDRQIPREVIERMDAQLVTNPPRKAEGFDRLVYVTASPGRVASLPSNHLGLYGFLLDGVVKDQRKIPEWKPLSFEGSRFEVLWPDVRKGMKGLRLRSQGDSTQYAWSNPQKKWVKSRTPLEQEEEPKVELQSLSADMKEFYGQRPSDLIAEIKGLPKSLLKSFVFISELLPKEALDYLKEQGVTIRSAEEQGYRLASGILKQGGVFEPPPQMVEGILRWSMAFVASRKIEGAEAATKRASEYLDTVVNGPDTRAYKVAESHLESAVTTGKAQPIAKAYAAFYEAGATLFGFYLPKATARDFSGLPGRLDEVKRFVDQTIQKGRVRLEQSVDQAQMSLKKSQVALESLKEHLVPGLNFNSDKVTKTFAVDLSGWKYDNQPLLHAYRARSLDRIHRHIEGIWGAQTNPELMSIFNSMVENAETAWKTIDVVFESTRSGSGSTASWRPAMKLLTISMPSAAHLDQIEEDLTTQIEHELRHMGQSILADMHRQEESFIGKRKPGPGMPSKRIMTPDKDQGASSDHYFLDDVEFYPNVADAVTAIRKVLQGLSQESEEVRQEVFLYLVGSIKRTSWTRTPPLPFLMALKKGAIGKWKKAVSEIYKKVFNKTMKTATLEPAARILANLLAHLRALQWFYLTAHWQASGESFYGDHLLFERMYDKTTEEVDGLAEKILGFYPTKAVDGPEQAKLMAFRLHEISSGPDLGVFGTALQTERSFQTNLKETLDTLKAIGKSSLGMEDLLATMANDHESHIYLLTQRTTQKTARVSSTRTKKANAFLKRLAALVGTEDATIYAISPSQMATLMVEGDWLKSWPNNPQRLEALVREHGGAVFQTGADGLWDVQVPGALGGLGFTPPYGTNRYAPGVSPANMLVPENAGYAFLISGGDTEDLSQMIAAKLLTQMPSSGVVVPHQKGAEKAFCFQWSHGQKKWRIQDHWEDFPYTLNGSNFILFIGPGARAPGAGPWTLDLMRFMAEKLPPPPRHAYSADRWEALTQKVARQWMFPTPKD